MRRVLVPVLLVLVVAVPFATAATSETIAISRSGFTPKTTTLAFGSRVTWQNDDTADHQVVANDGSFASPVLTHGKTYTFTFMRAGTFQYHDALHPSLKATITIKGPPPSLAIALDKPIVTYGTQVMLSGKAANVKVGTTVTLFAQPYGQPSPVQLAVVQSGTDGSFGYLRPRTCTRPTRRACRQRPGRSRAHPWSRRSSHVSSSSRGSAAGCTRR